MSMVTKFPPSVCEKMGYYVYLLKDPDTREVFYVGKGKGNRVFEHVNLALKSSHVKESLDKIREIHGREKEVEHVILRHGLTEEEALHVEASLIDHIGFERLTNKSRGHKSYAQGQMNITDVISVYDAPKAVIKKPSLLIRVNRLFRWDMSDRELYEITRRSWVLGERRNTAEYAFAVYHGIVRQVYNIHTWESEIITSDGGVTSKRWGFKGNEAKELQNYVGSSVEDYITPGAQAPIIYVNC